MANVRQDYKVVQKITLKMFKNYCKTINKQGYQRKRKDAYMTGVALLIIACLGWYIRLKFVAAFFVCLSLLYWIFPNLYWNKHIKDRYLRHKSLSKGEQKLHFYEDHFTVRWGKEKNTVSYKDLVRIIDGGDCWYLMVSEKDGQIVDKKQCDEDTLSFLQHLSAESH